MADGVDPAQRRVHGGPVPDVPTTRSRGTPSGSRRRAADDVEDDRLVARVEQRPDDGRSDEPGSAGDEDAHGTRR